MIMTSFGNVLKIAFHILCLMLTIAGCIFVNLTKPSEVTAGLFYILTAIILDVVVQKLEDD